MEVEEMPEIIHDERDTNGVADILLRFNEKCSRLSDQ